MKQQFLHAGITFRNDMTWPTFWGAVRTLCLMWRAGTYFYEKNVFYRFPVVFILNSFLSCRSLLITELSFHAYMRLEKGFCNNLWELSTVIWTALTLNYFSSWKFSVFVQQSMKKFFIWHLTMLNIRYLSTSSLKRMKYYENTLRPEKPHLVETKRAETNH